MAQRTTPDIDDLAERHGLPDGQLRVLAAAHANPERSPASRWLARVAGVSTMTAWRAITNPRWRMALVELGAWRTALLLPPLTHRLIADALGSDDPAKVRRAAEATGLIRRGGGVASE